MSMMKVLAVSWFRWLLNCIFLQFAIPNVQTNTSGVLNQQDPKQRVIAINGSAGAQVLITASISAGYIEIVECAPNGGTYGGGTFTGQGLNYQRADENYVNTYGLPPGVVIPIGDAIAKNRCVGMPGWTYPDGSVRPATPLVKVISATGTATQILVTEWRCRAGAGH